MTYFTVNDVQQVLNQNITGIDGYEGSRGNNVEDGNAFRLGTRTDKNDNFESNVDVFSGPNNQDHIALSFRNTGFLLYELTTRNGLAQSNGVLNARTYNYGESNNNFVATPGAPLIPRIINNLINFDLTVSGSGQLWVNRGGKIDFTDVGTNPNNKTGTTYTLNIRNQGGCDAGINPTVTFQNGGKLLVGDAAQNNYGVVRVWNGATVNFNGAGTEGVYEGGSKLIVESGGVVNVRDGGFHESKFGAKIQIKSGGKFYVRTGGILRLSHESILEIEQGGELIIETGAVVQLWDNQQWPQDATEDGRCAIIVKDGGKLTINGQFDYSGNGPFRFEYGNQFVLNGNLSLTGYGKNFAIISLAESATLNIENHSVSITNAAVKSPSISTLRIQPTANFTANNATFKRIFLEFITPANKTISFDNVRFEGDPSAIHITAPEGIAFNDWGGVNASITNCEFKNYTFIADRGFEIGIHNSKFDNNGNGLELKKVYWLNMTNTKILGGGSHNFTSDLFASKGIQMEDVIHGWVVSNSLIDNFDIGIHAKQGIIGNVFLDNGTTIQNCRQGVALNGGLNASSGLDFGMMYMNCARLINNFTGITGRDILFNMYGRGNQTNVLRKQTGSGFQTTLFFDINFVQRSPTDLWFHNTYWHNIGLPTNPTETSNSIWEFRANGIGINATIHTFGNISDPNQAEVVNCGGVNLTPRGEKRDPMSEDVIVFADGANRNVKVQYDAAMKEYEKKQFKKAVDLFEPIASLKKSVKKKDMSHSVTFFTDVARVMALGKVSDPKKRSNGWLPEATVGKTIDHNSLSLTVFPSPANDMLNIELENKNYVLSIFDPVGKLIFSKNTEGGLQTVDISNWASGLYIVNTVDTEGAKRMNKVVVQH